MKYRHLYAAGCSFTKHLPLNDGDQWPTMLGKKLNIPDVINQGQGGAGNDSIFKTVNNFILKTTTPADEILAVIQFTFPFRFTLPSGATFSGWQNYQNNYLSESSDTEISNHPDEVLNLEYYHARERMYAWHPCVGVWEFYQQISAISNLLSKAKIKHYCVCIHSPESHPEPVGGDHFGNPTGTIEFDQSMIDWLWEDVWQSNLQYQIDKLGLKNYTISDSDNHFNSKTHDHLTDAMVNRIKYLEEKA